MGDLRIASSFFAQSASLRATARSHFSRMPIVAFWLFAMPAYVRIRQHTSAYVSILPHTSTYVRIRPHTSEDWEWQLDPQHGCTYLKHTRTLYGKQVGLAVHEALS